MGEWFSANWVGVCLVGLVLLELAQRKYFPGERPFPWGWLGRTRRREIPGGYGSGARIVPRGNLSIQKILPQYDELASQLARDDPALMERRLRKMAAESDSEPSKVILSCLLAEAAQRRGDRLEAIECVAEAREILELRCDPSDHNAGTVWEWFFRFRSAHALQEGLVSQVLDILSEAESQLGSRDWISLSRAQVYLLAGREDLCRRETLPFQIERRLGKLGRLHPEEISARLLIAESYLQEGAMEKLRECLRGIGQGFRLPEQDQAILTRLQIELLLHSRNRRAAWRQVRTLAWLCEKSPNDRGLLRTLHLACAQIHRAEGDYVEAHRRLQLAENEAGYPVAQWETRLGLGMTLEAEGRFEEARQVWEELAAKARQTRYGALAESRRIRLPAPSHKITAFTTRFQIGSPL